ncbi:GIY-YIG nuclease family protein [Candidatus Kaiserbacteria bacterium]|nr:GIY-YIG nuclease family protein [Candidatus Kaiserbacteria bacterium]
MQRKDLKNFDLPDAPGIYKFLGPRREILYIGMATSLQSRVRSYFASDLVETRGSHIRKMVEDAVAVEWQQTDSVLEAMILEANLIKKHQPSANSRDRDNRSFNYLVITREDYLRVLVVRGRELFQKWQEKDSKHLFGPFPEGGSLKAAVKLVRTIFPFRDTCVPDSGKPCFNRQLGLCPGVCDGTVSKRAYAQTIRHIALLFLGKKEKLLEYLKKEMARASKRQQFEYAVELRRQIGALTHIRDVALIRRDSPYQGEKCRRAEATQLLRASADAFESRGGEVNHFRIEAYDVAHTSGTETVGVMTVVEGGEAKKSDYRMFNVRGFKNDDTGALKEILNRRLTHPEWPTPRLIVLDGGKGQLNAARNVLENAGIAIPTVAVVKDERHRPREVIGDAPYRTSKEGDIILVNSEAHRFALSYHKKRRKLVLP